MIDNFDWKGLPGWVILTLASVTGALFGFWLNAIADTRAAEKEREKANTECEKRIREMRETELAEWKSAFAALKKDQEQKLEQLTKFRKK